MVANARACWADVAQLALIYVCQAGHGKGAIRGANLDDRSVQNRTLCKPWIVVCMYLSLNQLAYTDIVHHAMAN
jgi:hypothetical protein